jgi:hypothetical protein
MKTLVVFQMLDILNTACRKIIYDKHFIATFKISIGEMRTDKSRSACNQYSQAIQAPFKMNPRV